VDGVPVIVGNDRMMRWEHIDHHPSTVEGTAVHIAVDRHYGGYLRIADTLTPDAIEAIRALRRLGVSNTVMLSGDTKPLHVRWHQHWASAPTKPNCSREGKVAALEGLLRQSDGGCTAFMGDGINDAPVRARADMGLVMGALGSGVAIETADVVIMTDAPSKVAEAISIGRRTRRRALENIVLAMSIKALFIALGTLGFASALGSSVCRYGVGDPPGDPKTRSARVPLTELAPRCHKHAAPTTMARSRTRTARPTLVSRASCRSRWGHSDAALPAPARPWNV